ncbi:MAG: hypothetical protein F4Y57_14095, partial [Acidobacteria bacterium]|nr:hypothetical protein [Acidobacteriota bacterium]
GCLGGAAPPTPPRPPAAAPPPRPPPPPRAAPCAAWGLLAWARGACVQSCTNGEYRSCEFLS